MTTTVGIMSMQRIFNYGSSLQAYGLRRLIESVDSEVRVSFLDFEPGEVLVREATPRSSSRVGRAVSKVLEYNAVDAKFSDKLRFFNHKRSYGKRYLPMIGVMSEPTRGLDVDVQVIGSDEVFNCVQSNTNVGYSRDLFGHGARANRLISYAGSFGNTTIAKIMEHGIARDLAEDLAAFHALSVRDRNSADIVEKLVGTAPEIHVDPALAFDFMDLEPQIPQDRQRQGKYLIVYGYSGRLSASENAALAEYARHTGAEILCFGGVQGCCDQFIDCDPFTLLAYFRDAEAVITDTFHGTIFAIINRRPFGTIIRPTVGNQYGNEEKLGYLLRTFGLVSQTLTDMDRVAEVLRTEIDFHGAERVLARERARTRRYLEQSISRS